MTKTKNSVRRPAQPSSLVACANNCGEMVRRSPSARGKRVFCSSECYHQASRSPGVQATCAGCTTAFTTKGSTQTKRAKDGLPVYHSADCARRASTAPEAKAKCAGCETEFTAHGKTQVERAKAGKPVYHSPECQQKATAVPEAQATCAGCEVEFTARGKTQVEKVEAGKPVYHSDECRRQARQEAREKGPLTQLRVKCAGCPQEFVLRGVEKVRRAQEQGIRYYHSADCRMAKTRAKLKCLKCGTPLWLPRQKAKVPQSGVLRVACAPCSERGKDPGDPEHYLADHRVGWSMDTW